MSTYFGHFKGIKTQVLVNNINNITRYKRKINRKTELLRMK